MWIAREDSALEVFLTEEEFASSSLPAKGWSISEVEVYNGVAYPAGSAALASVKCRCEEMVRLAEIAKIRRNYMSEVIEEVHKALDLGPTVYEETFNRIAQLKAAVDQAISES